MPPEPVPVVRFRAAVAVVVVLRCFRPPALLEPAPAPAPARGADSLLGDRVPAPTDVELAGAGCCYYGSLLIGGRNKKKSGVSRPLILCETSSSESHFAMAIPRLRRLPIRMRYLPFSRGLLEGAEKMMIKRWATGDARLLWNGSVLD